MKRLFATLLACASLGIFLGLGLGCQPKQAAGPLWMKNPERRPARELVLVLAPPVEQAKALVRALRSELSADFDVHVYPAERFITKEEIGALVRENDPNAVILVDNPTVTAYASWARTQHHPPASVIVMSSFAEQLQETVPNSTGISFEPPAVTSLLDLRRLLKVPVSKVGVVYRRGFEDYVNLEKRRAAREKIELVPIAVRSKPTPEEVHRALDTLRSQEIEALWVSNDNGLLTGHLLSNVWLPFVERHGLPVIVGVPSLLSDEVKLGTFAAVPDVEGLGVQTADLIYALAESSWTPPDIKVQPPLSVKTYVDLTRARRLGMTNKSELTVDVLLEGKD